MLRQAGPVLSPDEQQARPLRQREDGSGCEEGVHKIQEGGGQPGVDYRGRSRPRPGRWFVRQPSSVLWPNGRVGDGSGGGGGDRLGRTPPLGPLSLPERYDWSVWAVYCFEAWEYVDGDAWKYVDSGVTGIQIVRC